MTKTGGRVAQSAEEKRSLGALVRELRERLAVRLGKARVTQDEIADRGGFSRNEMSFFEKGEKLTSHENVKHLARGFGITMEALDAYLDLKISADEALSQTPSEERTVDNPVRYPSLRLVIEARANAKRWSPSAIAAAQSAMLDADEDPGEAHWIATLDWLDAMMRGMPKPPSRAGNPLAGLDERPVRTARKKR